MFYIFYYNKKREVEKSYEEEKSFIFVISYSNGCNMFDSLWAGGRHPQEGGPDHWDLGGPEAAEQVHGVPAGQRAAAQGVPLQAYPVPQEALGPQEGRQLCE